MSTLAEIEAAIEHLPMPERRELFTFLASKIERASSAVPADGDPFEAVVGTFAGAREATGRNAEAVLYGAPR